MMDAETYQLRDDLEYIFWSLRFDWGAFHRRMLAYCVCTDTLGTMDQNDKANDYHQHRPRVVDHWTANNR